MKTQKGFYVSLALGCLALFGIGTAYYNTQMKSLSETTPNQIVEENGETGDKTVKNTPDYYEQLENDIELDEPWAMTGQNTNDDDTEKTTTGQPEQTAPEKTEDKTAKADDDDAEKEADTEEENKAVGSFDPSSSVSLSFEEENGLAWPMQGEVLLNYAMDSVVYFSTLNQYKCNPALLLKADLGTPVHAAAKCYVTGVQENDETGLTVSTSIGNDYEVIYGQLEELAVEEGDVLEEGDLIGYVSEPTAYFTKEGSNLWLQVKEKDETVDPLLLLR